MHTAQTSLRHERGVVAPANLRAVPHQGGNLVKTLPLHRPSEEGRQRVAQPVARFGRQSVTGHPSRDERRNLSGGDGLEVRGLDHGRFAATVLARLWRAFLGRGRQFAAGDREGWNESVSVLMRRC